LARRAAVEKLDASAARTGRPRQGESDCKLLRHTQPLLHPEPRVSVNLRGVSKGLHGGIPNLLGPPSNPNHERFSNGNVLMSARTTARESSMPLPLREDSEGVASTVATMFTLLVILLFIQLTVVEVVPAQEYNAEWATSRAAIDAFERLRLATQLAAVD